MGYTEAQSLRAMEWIADAQPPYSIDCLSLAALQSLAHAFGKDPPMRYEDIQKARVNLKTLIQSKPNIALEVALRANAFAADDLEFLHAQQEAVPGAFSVIKITKHALPTTALVHRVAVFQDHIDGTLRRQIGLHVYDLGMEKCIYVKLADCEVIKRVPHAVPPMFDRFQIPEELNWADGSRIFFFFASRTALCAGAPW